MKILPSCLSLHRSPSASLLHTRTHAPPFSLLFSIQNHADKHPRGPRRLPCVCAGLSRPAVSAAGRVASVGEGRAARSRRAITLTNLGECRVFGDKLHNIHGAIRITWSTTSHSEQSSRLDRKLLGLSFTHDFALRKSPRGWPRQDSREVDQRSHSTCPNQPPCFAHRPFQCELTFWSPCLPRNRRWPP